MSTLSHCPLCNKKLSRQNKNECPNCGFDLIELKVKCKNCGNLFPIEKKICNKCNFIHDFSILPLEIENAKKLIKARRTFIYASLFDAIFLISWISLNSFKRVSLIVLSLFIFSMLRMLLFFKVKTKPVKSFIYGFILLIPNIIFLIDEIYYSIYLLPFIIPYIILFKMLAFGYETAWKTKDNMKNISKLL